MTIASSLSRIAAGWCANESQLTAKIIGSFFVLVLLFRVGWHVRSKNVIDSPQEVINALVDIRDGTTSAVVLICVKMFSDVTKG